MDRDQFIELVHRRGGVPASRRLDGMPLTNAETAETLVRATLQGGHRRRVRGRAGEYKVLLDESD